MKQIIYTAGPEKYHRLTLAGFLSKVIVACLRQGVLLQWPDQIQIYGHFLRADLPTFTDFWSTASRLKVLGRTITSSAPIGVPVDIDGELENNRVYRGERIVLQDRDRRPHTINVRFIDTMLLTPGRANLALAGDLIGLPKLSIPSGYLINGLDLLLADNKMAYEAYALRDAEIALAYGLRMASMAKSIGLHGMPLTLASMAVPILRQSLKSVDIEFDEAFGLEEHRERYYNKATNRYRTIRRRNPIFDRLIIDEFAAAAFHGGRNECYMFGPTRCSTIYDFDLPGAYTTVLCALRPLDYGGAFLSNKTRDFGIDVMGVARVSFCFPTNTRFPCLPVRTERGLIFPLSGVSVCTSPEIALAIAMGSEVTIINGMVVPWASEDRIFEKFTQYVQERRRSASKGSFEDLVWKEIGNSLYGKVSQGVREKRVFDSEHGGSIPLKPSSVTSPWFAAYTTGFVRSILGEILAGVSDDRMVVSATTDGLLTDSPLDELSLNGPLCSRFLEFRDLLFSDHRVIEEKHRVAQVIAIKTRGQVTAEPITGHPLVLAKAGVYFDAPKSTHNDLMLDLFINRQPGQTTLASWLMSAREQWLGQRDLLSVDRERRLNLEFDFKRRPVNPVMRQVGQTAHLAFDTKPWLTTEDALNAMVRFEGWRHGHCRILRTLRDFDDWTAYHLSVSATRAAGVSTRDGPLGVFKRQFLRALVRGEWGLSLDGWTYEEVAVWLSTAGFETSSDDLKNAKGTVGNFVLGGVILKQKETLNGPTQRSCYSRRDP